MSPPRVCSVSVLLSCVAEAMLGVSGLAWATYPSRRGVLVCADEVTNQAPSGDDTVILGAVAAGTEIAAIRS